MNSISRTIKVVIVAELTHPYPTMVNTLLTSDGDDDMNISYVNSNETTSLPVWLLDALNNKDISYAKEFLLVKTQLKIPERFFRPKDYQVLCK